MRARRGGRRSRRDRPAVLMECQLLPPSRTLGTAEKDDYTAINDGTEISVHHCRATPLRLYLAGGKPEPGVVAPRPLLRPSGL